MHTAWRLGDLAEFKSLRLREWCHMLGFRGHNTTTSRRFSVTRTRLGVDCAEFREHQRHPDPAQHEVEGEVATEANWAFVASGYLSPPMENYVAGMRERKELNDELAAEALDEIRREEERYDWAGPDQ